MSRRYAREDKSAVDPGHRMMKSRVLEALGMTELRRASGLSDALAANDRVKYYFSLLQMALEPRGSSGSARLQPEA